MLTAVRSNLYSLASFGLALTKPEDREWLKRKKAVLKDVIEQSWIYQEWIQEAQDKGIQQGRQEGLQALCQTVVEVVQDRFPELLDVARQRVDSMQDTVKLRRLIVKMSSVQTVQDAALALVALDR